MRQVAISAILLSQHTVVNHKAIVALQQDRERQQQEQVQRRRRRRRRQRSCWVRDWLLHGERLRHSQYYTLFESLREKDSGSEFLAGCFDQTAAFFLLGFLLWPLVVTLVSETVSSKTGSVCWEGVVLLSPAPTFAATLFTTFWHNVGCLYDKVLNR